MIIALIFIALIIISYFRYRIDTRDTIVAFTGGLGSGKTFWSVKTALEWLRRYRLEWRIRRIVDKDYRKKYPIRPQLYSSIPVRISRREMSRVLTPDILLLQDPIPEHSVVLIDEIGGFCSQFDYKIKNVEYFDDFVRYFRHYIGGKLIVNDQCSENILLQVRRRLNTVYNLMRCRFWGIPLGPKFLATVRVRNISVSEEIKTIEEGHTEEDHSLSWTLVPFRPRYATRCYRIRYEDLGNEYSLTAYPPIMNTRRRLRMVSDEIPDKISLKKSAKLRSKKSTEMPEKLSVGAEEEEEVLNIMEEFKKALDKFKKP